MESIKIITESEIISELKSSGIHESFYSSETPAIVITEAVIEKGEGKYDFPIHTALKWDNPAKLPENYLGMIFTNEDGKVWHSKLFDKTDGEKTGRYMAPKDNGDQPFLPSVPKEIREKIAANFNVKVPDTGNFWQWFLSNKNIPVILTEGGKKSLAALSKGYPAISLYGCQCGLIDRSFVKEKFANYLVDRQVYIALDQDENKGPWDKFLTVETVRQCKMELGTAISKIASQVKMCGWDTTDEKLGKGLDDCHEFIDMIINNALKFKAWLRSYVALKTVLGTETYVSDLVCKFFKSYFGKSITFDEQNEEWFWFNKKNWEVIKTSSLRVKFKQILDKFQLPFRDFNWLENIIKSCSIYFSNKIDNQWEEPKLLNFQNGILNIETKELIPHNHQYKMLYCLPRDYVPTPQQFNIFDQLKEKCPVFWNWVNFATNGHQQKIFKILCFCNGVLTRKFYQLKKFIFVKGKPDTGKSTFLNLLRNLIGIENSSASNIQSLNKDRGNELADIINKPLVVFPDEDKQYNGHSTLKTLTGHTDGISFRENYKQKKTQFFKGTIAIASNYHIFLGDTSGLDQRMAFLSLERQVPIEKRDPDLDEKLNNELGALTSIVLAIAPDLVTEYIQNRQRGYIPELKSIQWESRCESDSIAAWLNENTIFDENAKVQIGKATYTDSNYAYANYSAWYNENFSNPSNKVSVCKFTQKVEEIGHELGMPVWKKKEPTANFIHGITLRRLEEDDAIPYYSELIKFDEYPIDISDSLNIGGYVPKQMEASGNLKEKIVESKPAPNKDHGGYGEYGGLKVKNFKFNISHRPNSQEIDRHKFTFCKESDWTPTSDYMQFEYEAIQFILKHFPEESKGRWMPLAKFKQIFWPNKTTPVMPTFTKYFDIAFELLEYQGFLISRNRDHSYLNTDYMIKG